MHLRQRDMHLGIICARIAEAAGYEGQTTVGPCMAWVAEQIPEQNIEQTG